MIKAPIKDRNINLIRNYCELKGIKLNSRISIEHHLSQIELGNPNGCTEELKALTEHLPEAITILAIELGYTSSSLFLHRYSIEPFTSSTIILAIYIGMARFLSEHNNEEAHNV